MGLNRRQEQQVETRRFLKRLPYCLAITRAFYSKTPTWRVTCSKTRVQFITPESLTQQAFDSKAHFALYYNTHPGYRYHLPILQNKYIMLPILQNKYRMPRITFLEITFWIR